MIGSLLRKKDETISWDIKVIPLRCIDNKASLQQICSIPQKWIESPMIPHVFPCQHKQQVTGRNLEGNMSLMGSKAREFCSKIPVYQKIRAQYIDITSKSTKERSNTTAEKIDTKKQSDIYQNLQSWA